MSNLSTQELEYYDLQVQQVELDRKMDLLNIESQQKLKEHEKLSLFYQHELQQWLSNINKQKIESQKKRDNLSKLCTELQQNIKHKYSSNMTNLKKEKELYCKIIIKLLPEHIQSIERKQMKQINDYENRLSLIQQRRHIADIAFEKEKKLLSLLKIRQNQIHKLENEEKNDALFRENERNLIQKNENNAKNVLKLSNSTKYIDTKLYEYFIRKEVTNELEEKYKNKLINNDDTKTKFIQNKETAENAENDIQTETLCSDSDNDKDEEKEDIVNEQSDKNEDNDEQKDKDIKEEKQNKEGFETGSFKINNQKDIIEEDKDDIINPVIHNATIDIKENNLLASNNMIMNNSLELSIVESESSSLSDEEFRNNASKHNHCEIDTDTKKIEKELASIVINSENSQQNSNEMHIEPKTPIKQELAETPVKQESAKINISDIVSKPKQVSPSTKPQQTQQSQKTDKSKKIMPSRLKKSFRGRASKSRLQLSVLQSPSQDSFENEDIDEPIIISDRKSVDNKEYRMKIQSLNDFEEDKPTILTNDDDSSDDEFDF